MSDNPQFAAAMASWIASLPVGAAAGIVFGPLRLAGVDFSKWFADPGEISEGADHTWIGMMKWTALHTGRWLGGAAVLAFVAYAVGCWVCAWMHGPWTHEVVSYDFRHLWISVLTSPFWGFVAGIALVQAVVEITWRRGLLKSYPRPTRRLTRHHARGTKAPEKPNPARRRLVICCDGTWNSPLQKRETNVVALLRGITPMAQRSAEEQRETGRSDPIPQIVLYHLGVGTGNFFDRMIGGGAGVGLSNSVKACYGFLVDNYQPGDEILLFGFSRGAYVVRSVAGMIGCVGLLRKSQMHRFIEAWDYYTLAQPEQDAQRARFEDIFKDRVKDVEILCLGVWDTVGALGIPGMKVCAQAYAFHRTKLGDHVRHAYQALAMDERRGNFQPAIWTREKDDAHRPLEQMWFPGVHSNIGGGYDEHGLADAALLWMLSRIDHHKLLDVDRDVVKESLARYCAEPYGRGKLQDSRTTFWKMIASPIPRPVCITDSTEHVHQSASERAGGISLPDDPYAAGPRRNWLRTVTIAPRTTYESAPGFQVGFPGTKVDRSIDPKSGMCVRMMRWMVGQ